MDCLQDYIVVGLFIGRFWNWILLHHLDSCAADKRDEATQRSSGNSLLSHIQDNSPDKRIMEVGRK